MIELIAESVLKWPVTAAPLRVAFSTEVTGLSNFRKELLAELRYRGAEVVVLPRMVLPAMLRAADMMGCDLVLNFHTPVEGKGLVVELLKPGEGFVVWPGTGSSAFLVEMADTGTDRAPETPARFPVDYTALLRSIVEESIGYSAIRRAVNRRVFVISGEELLEEVILKHLRNFGVAAVGREACWTCVAAVERGESIDPLMLSAAIVEAEAEIAIFISKTGRNIAAARWDGKVFTTEELLALIVDSERYAGIEPMVILWHPASGAFGQWQVERGKNIPFLQEDPWRAVMLARRFGDCGIAAGAFGEFSYGRLRETSPNAVYTLGRILETYFASSWDPEEADIPLVGTGDRSAWKLAPFPEDLSFAR